MLPPMRPIAALALLLALATGAAAAAGEPAAPLPFVLTAATVTLDLARNTAEAVGNATLTRGDMTLRARRITANRVTGQVRATGGLVLTQQGRRLTGEALEYDVPRQEGTLTRARAQEQGVIIRGERIDFSPTKVVAHNALLTTCDRPQPDYAFAASQITLTATRTNEQGRPVGGRVTLRRPRVVFHGRTLLRLPSYSTTVGQIQQRRVSLLPVVGYSHLDGPYLALAPPIRSREGGLATSLELRLTSRRGVRGLVDLRDPVGAGTAYLRYAVREDVSEGSLATDKITLGLADVLVDRKPEVGWLLADRRMGRSVHLWAQAAAGRYREEEVSGPPETVSASRAMVLVLATADPYPASQRVMLSHGLGYRFTSYSGGDNLGVLYLRNSVDYQASPDNALTLSYTLRSGSGTTPFQFDEVDVPAELRADLRYRLSPRWRTRLVDVYDLREDRTRDMLLSLTRTAHCLDYTIGWKKRHNSFFVGITIVPAGGGPAPAAAAPPAGLPIPSGVTP
jgi:lipopolysaccharide export system protein LptA